MNENNLEGCECIRFIRTEVIIIKITTDLEKIQTKNTSRNEVRNCLRSVVTEQR